MQESVGELVRKFRENRGLSQEELGKLVEPPMNRVYIARIEAGTINPSPPTIERLAKALKVFAAQLQAVA